jgi:hypothetical protein
VLDVFDALELADQDARLASPPSRIASSLMNWAWLSTSEK